MKHFSWRAVEYVYREKSQDWFWTLGILATAGAITSLIFGNVLFAIVIAIGAFAVALHASRPPGIVEITVTQKGVAANKELYPYASLESFWIDEIHHDGPRLILRSKKVVMPIIMFPIADTEIEHLRAHLAKHLKEVQYEESMANHIMDRFGF